MRLSKQFILILDLGSIQVFCWQSYLEIISKAPHKDVSWRHKTTGHTHGPFPTLFDCMKHYTSFIDIQKTSTPVIFVDFRSKKRIIYKHD